MAITDCGGSGVLRDADRPCMTETASPASNVSAANGRQQLRSKKVVSTDNGTDLTSLGKEQYSSFMLIA